MDKGDEDYARLCPRTVKAMQNAKKNHWDKSPRKVKKRPAGFKPILAPGSFTTPKDVIPTNVLDEDASSKNKTKTVEDDIRRGVEAEAQQEGASSRNDLEEGDPLSFYTDELRRITKEARESREAWVKLHAGNTGIKTEDGAWVASEEGITSLARILSGVVVMDGNDFVRVSEVLKALLPVPRKRG